MSYVIGIGGVRATGKTTLSRSLSGILVTEPVSLGRFRAFLRGIYQEYGINTIETLPEFYQSITRTTNVDEAAKYLKLQAQHLIPGIDRMVRHCRERKSNLVVEGTHVYPGIYPEGMFDLQVLLVAPSETIERRLYKNKLRVKESDNESMLLQRNIELQEYLLQEAVKNNIHIINSESVEGALVKTVKLMPVSEVVVYHRKPNI